MIGFPPRVHCRCATVGTGALELGAPLAGKQSMPASYDTARIDYAVVDGDAWEEGWGIYDAGADTLTRNLLASSTGDLISLSGNAHVFSTIASATMERLTDETVNTVPYDDTMFTSAWTGAIGTWTVQEGDVSVFEYRMLGLDLMHVQVVLVTTSLADPSATGSVASGVIVALPNGRQARGSQFGVGKYTRRLAGTTFERELIEVTASGGLLFQKTDGSTFVNANNQHRFEFSGVVVLDPA